MGFVIQVDESDPGARPVMQEWVTKIRDQCLRAKVPFFFKQWGGVQKKRAGRTLEGHTWDEMPGEINLVKHRKSQSIMDWLFVIYYLRRCDP
jgi:protein gp37